MGFRLRAEAMDARGDAGAPAADAAAARVVGEPETHNLRAKQALAEIKLGDPPGGLRVLDGKRPTSPDGRLAEALAFAGAAALGFADPAIGTAKATEARRMALDAGDPDAPPSHPGPMRRQRTPAASFAGAAFRRTCARPTRCRSWRSASSTASSA